MPNWTASMHKIQEHKDIMKIFSTLILTPLLLLLICSSGCVAARGKDFGHWARTAEKIRLVHIYNFKEQNSLNDKETILLLPPVGRMPGNNLKDLQSNMYQEMRNYFPVSVFTTTSEKIQTDYMTDDNLYLTGDKFNPGEVGRLGKLMGASQVICTHVRDFRPYLPQVLALYIVVVNTVSGEITAEINATFDSAEQQVILAAGEYMQSRRARKFDSQSLDILLRSPTEYSAFVSAQCASEMKEKLWLKN